MNKHIALTVSVLGGAQPREKTAAKYQPHTYLTPVYLAAKKGRNHPSPHIAGSSVSNGGSITRSAATFIRNTLRFSKVHFSKLHTEKLLAKNLHGIRVHAHREAPVQRTQYASVNPARFYPPHSATLQPIGGLKIKPIRQQANRARYIFQQAQPLSNARENSKTNDGRSGATQQARTYRHRQGQEFTNQSHVLGVLNRRHHKQLRNVLRAEATTYNLEAITVKALSTINMKSRAFYSESRIQPNFGRRIARRTLTLEKSRANVEPHTQGIAGLAYTHKGINLPSAKARSIPKKTALLQSESPEMTLHTQTKEKAPPHRHEPRPEVNPVQQQAVFDIKKISRDVMKELNKIKRVELERRGML